jgi:hypothetical protein
LNSCNIFCADGFRKVRSDLNQNALWWEFKHPLFKRGQPELLVEIKKSVHFEAPAPAPTAENVKEIKDEVRQLREQMRMMETMMREMAFRSNDRQMVGIAPHHVGMGAGQQINVQGLAPNVSIGIPLENMSSPAAPLIKKRQRVSSTDVVPMQPASSSGCLPNFQESVLGPTVQIKQESALYQFGAIVQSASASTMMSSSNLNPGTPKNFDDSVWDEMMESFFESGMDETLENHDDEDGRDDWEGGDDTNLTGTGNDDNMFVVPATIVMNEPSIQHWEWAAVGQLLNEEGQRNCQVDQLADALLFSSLAPILGNSTQLPEQEGGGPMPNGPTNTTDTDYSSQPVKATAQQLEGMQHPAANVDSLISALLLLPLPLQNRFVDRLADVLGKQLADHLGRQADEVHLAMVEASSLQSYYSKKETENLMDVSHYTQVITAQSNPASPIVDSTTHSTEHMPTTVASQLHSSTQGPVADPFATPEVHAMAQVIGSAAANVNQAMPYVVGFQANNSSSAFNVQLQSIPVASTVLPPHPQYSSPAPSAPALPSAPLMPTHTHVIQALQSPSSPATSDSNPRSQPSSVRSNISPAPGVHGPCYPCETCAHCRANMLLNSYQPQQFAEAYPLAAAALGALLLRWGEACTRHQS